MYLKVKNLVKHYSSEFPIIKDLSFSVNKGELISFLGESGSGKTTFLKCLAGLEKINSGYIELNGSVLNDNIKFEPPQNRKIGFVFQDYPLFPHLNLEDNITFNLEKEYNKNLDSILKLTGLKFLLERYPHELSGGEQQRACIARALIREPDLLLLDEPFSNLDTTIKDSMREEIYRIIKKTNTTSILVTHDINDALNISFQLDQDHGKFSCFSQVTPLSLLNLTKPSSVPTTKKPFCSLDSSKATIVPSGEVKTFLNIASTLQTFPITFILFLSSSLVRSR